MNTPPEAVTDEATPTECPICGAYLIGGCCPYPTNSSHQLHHWRVEVNALKAANAKLLAVRQAAERKWRELRFAIEQQAADGSWSGHYRNALSFVLGRMEEIESQQDYVNGRGVGVRDYDWERKAMLAELREIIANYSRPDDTGEMPG